MGIEVGEEVQAKGMRNIFNKIIKENFPMRNRKLCPFTFRKPPEHQADLAKIELPHDILSFKQHAQRLEKEY
jgi:hypothetical protein